MVLNQTIRCTDQQRKFIDLVLDERMAQDQEWGGASHDDQHTPEQWIALLVRHTGLAVDDGTALAEDRYRKQLVRVAALALAALESLDRKVPENKGPIELKSDKGY